MNQRFIGQTIGGCTIKENIGEGGGGMVFLGEHPDLGSNIVLKILPKDKQEDEQSRLRFEREIDLSLDLEHPNIVQIYQASADDTYYYILMEHVDGSDIESAVMDHGCFEWPKAVKLGAQVASALAFAHSKQIIHRDIKPSNILLNKKQTSAKLCDFGLAKNLNVESNLTHTGMVLGTPNFMSPEQWFGTKNLNHQTDIYSLGATLFFMITGKKPHEGESATAIMTNSLFSEAPAPCDHMPNLPAKVNGVIQKMLARDLEARFQDASLLAEELQKLAKNKGTGFLGKLFGK